MSNTESAAAAAARKTQAEYLEGLQREAQAYKDAGRKDRLAEVQAEIKRTEALLDVSKATRAAKGKGGKGGKGAAAPADTPAGDDAGGADDGSDGAGDGTAGD